MKALQRIETLAQQCELQGKYYLIGLDEDGNYCGEVDSCNSYCLDCAIEKAKELNEELQRNGYEFFSKEHDCPDRVISSISYNEESSPEDDDFLTCESCGSEINVGVLFTYDDELRYWIDTDIDIDNLSPQSAYRINECLSSNEAAEKFPELVYKLKEKIAKL